MHYVAYVLVSETDAKTSLEAREEVMRELENDSTFINEGGRFSSPVCDWFRIGGRWSGELYPKQLRQEFYRQVDQLKSGDKPGWYSENFIDKNREQLDALWQKLGGKHASPLTRDQSEWLGYEDDAKLLDRELAEELNGFLQNTDEYVNDEEHCILRKRNWLEPVVISLDSEALFELNDFNNLVGKYWVVVIDYHK